MKKLFNLLIVLAIALTACSSDDDKSSDSGQSNAKFTSEDPARVLRLDSYHPEYLWSVAINSGLEQAFSEAGLSVLEGNLSVDYFYMDTKRQSSTDYFEQIALDAVAYIRETKPDVVIANDNNAVRLVVQAVADDLEIPFIFCGLNDDATTYGLVNRPNVTGVQERIFVQQSFDWITSVFGDTVRVALLFDDSATTGAYLRDVNVALESAAFAESTVETTNSYAEWQQFALTASETSDVIVIGTYHTLRDADDLPVPENTALEWLVNNSSVPIVPFWEFSIPFGALGGPVISGETQGYEAGKMAVEVLNGTPAEDIPITSPAVGKVVLNQAAMLYWNVTIPDDIREGAEIYIPE